MKLPLGELGLLLAKTRDLGTLARVREIRISTLSDNLFRQQVGKEKGDAGQSIIGNSHLLTWSITADAHPELLPVDAF